MNLRRTVSASLRSRRGLTLVELVIALAIFAVIMVPIVLILTSAGGGYAATSQRIQLERRARQALEAITGALADAGADPTGAGVFEAVPEAAPTAVTVAADLGGDEPGTPPDGDAEDPAERLGFRLLPGGELVAEVQQPGEAFERLSRTLTRDVRDFSLRYLDPRDRPLPPDKLTEDELEGVLARRRIRSIEIRLELAPPGGEAIVLTSRVTPRNLAATRLPGAGGGGFPRGEEAATAEGPAVPAEGAPPTGPPELVSQGAAAELRGAGIGDPVVIFYSPAAGGRLGGPTPVAAAAEDDDGTVRQVDFYLDDRVLGADGYAPYQTPSYWNPLSGEFAVADGHHLLYALAVDNRNNYGSDALLVETAGAGGPALLLDAAHPAYLADSRNAACWIANGGDADLVVTELRPAWNRDGLLLESVALDGDLLYSSSEGSASGASVRLEQALVLPPGQSGELTLGFTAAPGALRPSLEEARLAVLFADGVGRRWGVHCLLTPTAFKVSNLLVSGSHYASRWSDYYETARLTAGARPYTDEDFTLTTLPTSYEAPLWIRAPDADRVKGLDEPELGADYLGSIHTDNRLHLYLLYTDDATPPLWIRDRFIESDYVFTTDNPRAERLRLWLAVAPPGEIVFYGNRSAGASDNADCMYLLGLGGLFSE